MQGVLTAMGALTTLALTQSATVNGAVAGGRRLTSAPSNVTSLAELYVNQTQDAITAAVAGVLAGASAGLLPVNIKVSSP